MRRHTGPAISGLTVVLVLVLAACTSATTGTGSSDSLPQAGTGAGTPTSSSPLAATSSRPNPVTSSSAPRPSTALAVLSAMSESQRIGQLFMVDCASTYVSQQTLDDITNEQVGSIILDGTSSLSLQRTAAITRELQAHEAGDVGLFIATDQEGGEVQRLTGPGFSAIPSAVTQGSYATSTLRADAKLWGTQLRQAGVNIDLAPVLDTVPANFGNNPPIGDLDREYGHTVSAVSSHGTAFAQGLQDAGVLATAKHFPGLGRTAGNTDLSSGVQDTVTTRHDAYLEPFANAITAGVPFVMISTAIYTRIDAGRPAAFSRTIVTDMLRGDLGFRGVIISDDLGVAKQVSGFTLGQRAIDFIAAGGDLVLTVDASQIPAMASAVLALTRASASFRNQVDAAALTILEQKQASGLLG